MYRCVAITPEGFIQQLAVCYVARGYWFYVTGEIPATKDFGSVDRKLLARYRVDLSKWARVRRKKAGLANVHYLRHGRFFVLLATHGQHELFSSESAVLRDARRSPIRFAGYSVSFRGGHVHVRIDHAAYLDLKTGLLHLATRASIPELCKEFRCVPYEPYAPVRRQLLALWRAVNRARKTVGLDSVPVECIRLRRRIMRPFGDCSSSGVLLPGHDELPGAAVTSEPGDVDACPEGADSYIKSIEITEHSGTVAGPKGKYAARQEQQDAEVD